MCTAPPNYQLLSIEDCQPYIVDTAFEIETSQSCIHFIVSKTEKMDVARTSIIKSNTVKSSIKPPGAYLTFDAPEGGLLERGAY